MLLFILLRATATLLSLVAGYPVPYWAAQANSFMSFSRTTRVPIRLADFEVSMLNIADFLIVNSATFAPAPPF